MIPNVPEKRPSRGEQLKELYLKQKHVLDLFLERGAISREQYDKSLGDLSEKMGMKDAAPERELPCCTMDGKDS